MSEKYEEYFGHCQTSKYDSTFLQKQATAFSRSYFSKKTPSLMFEGFYLYPFEVFNF